MHEQHQRTGWQPPSAPPAYPTYHQWPPPPVPATPPYQEPYPPGHHVHAEGAPGAQRRQGQSLHPYHQPLPPPHPYVADPWTMGDPPPPQYQAAPREAPQDPPTPPDWSEIEPHGVYISNSECTLFELRADSDQSSSFIIIIIHHASCVMCHASCVMTCWRPSMCFSHSNPKLHFRSELTQPQPHSNGFLRRLYYSFFITL